MSRRPRPRRPPAERRSGDLDGRWRPGSGPASDPNLDTGPDPDTERSALAPDRRAVSTTLDYTLSLAIATIVITGLFLAAGDFVESQRERVVETELRVIGERIVSDVAAADRLVEAGDGSTTVVVNQSLPAQITGLTYRVEVAVDSGTNWVNLSTSTPDVSVAVQFDTATPVAERTVVGGDVSVVYTGTELEVRS